MERKKEWIRRRRQRRWIRRRRMRGRRKYRSK